MRTIEKLKDAVLFRSGKNSHRYFYFLHGKLRSFVTHEKDVLFNLAAMFGNLNACFPTVSSAFFRRAMAMSMLVSLLSPTVANALPQGGESVAGNVSFSQPNASTLNIHSSSQRSIANYQSFSIARGETVNIQLPNASAAMLNRVIGRNPSEIFGSLNSNGQVFLVNPSGIIFGAGAQVNVGALFASTLDISNHDFLNGKMVFTKNPAYGPASITNEGIINIQKGGAAVLMASAVQNKGTINAPQGQVHLAVGDQITMAMTDGVVADVTVDKALQSKVEGVQNAISNTGSIKADGGLIKMQAELANNIYDRLINNEGLVQAQGVEVNNGVVSFVGKTESGGGLVQNTGTVDVSGNNGSPDGGDISIEGDNVQQSGTLLADASEGGTGGNIYIHSTEGTELSSGSLTSARGAGENSNGGEIIVLSEKTTEVFQEAQLDVSGGSVSGDGGFMEVSGKETVNFLGQANLGANDGESGTLLIDPTNYTLNDAQYNALKNTNGNLLLWATNNLTVDSETNQTLSFTSINSGSETLTLRAGGNLDVNDNLSTSGGKITLLADADMTGSASGTTNQSGSFGGTASDGVGTLSIASGKTVNSGGGDITASGAAITLTGNLNSGNGDTSLTTSTGNITGAGTITADKLTITTTSGNATQNGTVGGTALSTAINSLTANSTSGTIKVSDSGAIDINASNVGTGTLAVTAGNNSDIDIVGNISGGTVSLTSSGSGDIQGNNTITATNLNLTLGSGDATQDGSSSGNRLNTNVSNLTVTGSNADVRISNSNDLTIHASNLGSGSLDVRTANNKDITIGGNITADDITLEVQSNSGDIKGTGTLIATNLDLQLGNGNATQDGTAGGAALNTQITNLSVDFGSGTVRVSDVNGINLENTTSYSSSGTLALQAGGAGNISQNGQIEGGTLELTLGTGSATLTDTDNDVTNLKANSSGGNVTFTDYDSVNLQTSNVGSGTLKVTASGRSSSSSGDITQSGVITAGTLEVALDSGTVTLNNSSNNVTNFKATTNDGDVSYTDANAVNIQTTNLDNGALTVTASGDITQSGSITADTLNVIVNSGSATLNNANNDVDDLQATATGGSFEFTDKDTLTVKTSTVTGGQLKVKAAGDITASGNLQAETLLSIQSTGGNINMDQSSGSARTHTAQSIELLANNGTGKKVIVNKSGTLIHATGTGSGGDQTFDPVTNPINVGDTISTGGGGTAGTVTITGVLQNAGTIQADGTGGGDVNINYGGVALNLTNVSITASAGGTTGSITVNAASPASGSGTNGTLVRNGGSGSGNGEVNVTADSVSGTGTSVTANELNFDVTNALTLSGNFNNTPISVLNSGSTSLTDTTSALNIAELNATTTASLFAKSIALNGAVNAQTVNLDVSGFGGGTGNITQTDAIIANTLNVTVGSGSATLEDADNNVTDFSATATANGSVSYTDKNSVNLLASNVGTGTLEVTASGDGASTAGDITQSGAVTAGTLAVNLDAGTATLNSTSNNVANFQASASGGDVNYTNTDGFNVLATDLDDGTLSLTADAAGSKISFTGNTSAGDVNTISDDLDVNSGVTVSAIGDGSFAAPTGTISINPKNADRNVVIGGPGGTADSLEVDSNELLRLNAGNVEIGNDVTLTSDINIASDLDLSVLGFDMDYKTTGDIISNNHVFNLGSFELNFDAGGNITLNTTGDNRALTFTSATAGGNVDIDTNGANSGVNASGKINAAGNVTIDTNGANSGITVTGGIDPAIVSVNTVGDGSSISLGNVVATDLIQLTTDGVGSTISVTDVDGGATADVTINTKKATPAATSISVTNNVAGDNVSISADVGGNGSTDTGIDIGGNVTANGNMTISTTDAQVHVGGNITSNGGGGTTTTLSAVNSGFFLDGSLTMPNNTNKNVSFRDDAGYLGLAGNSLYSNAYFDTNFTFNNITLASAGNLPLRGNYSAVSQLTLVSLFGTNNVQSAGTTLSASQIYLQGDGTAQPHFGSLANPLNIDTPILNLQDVHTAIVIKQTATPLNLTSSGSGVNGGTLKAQAQGNINVNSAFTNADLISLETLGGSGSINVTQNITGASGVNLVTAGTGNVNVSNGVTVRATNNPINITANDLNLNSSGALNAGTGTVTLTPNGNKGIDVAGSGSGTFKVSASELSRVTAGKLVIGDLTKSGNLTVLGNINLNTLNYDLTLFNAGNITSSGNTFTTGTHQLLMQAGNDVTISRSGLTNSLTLSANHTIQAGHDINISTNGLSAALSVSGPLTAGNDVILRTQGLSSSLTNNGAVNAGRDVTLSTSTLNSGLTNTGAITATRDVSLSTTGLASTLNSNGTIGGRDVTLSTGGLGVALNSNGAITATRDISLSTSGAGAALNSNAVLDGRDVTLSTTGIASALTSTGNITSSRDVELSTTAGLSGLTVNGTIGATNDVTLSTSGVAASLTVANNVTADNDLTVSTTGIGSNISQTAGTMSATNQASLSASGAGSNITQTQGATITAPDIILNAAGNIADATSGALDLNATNLTINNNVVGTNVDVRDSAGGVNIVSARANDDLTITGADGLMTLAGNVTGGTNAGDVVTLSTLNGGITQNAGTVSGTTVNMSTDGADADIFQGATGVISGTTLNLTALGADGDIAQAHGGQITGTNITLNTTGDIADSVAGALELDAVNLTITNTNNATLEDANGINLAGATANNLTVTETSGDITTSGAVTVTNTVDLSTTGGTGNITVNAGGPVSGATVNLTTGAATTSGNITGGLISGTDVNLRVNNATGDIDVDTESTNLLATANMTDGDITVNESTGVNIVSATGSNVTVVAANGDITTSGAVTATNTADLSTTGGTGDININAGGPVSGTTVNLTTGAATTSGNVNLAEDVDGVPFGTSTVNIEALGASGDITRTASRIRANSVSLHSANGDIGVNTNNGRIRTRTNFLTVQADNGNAYLRENNSVTLLSSNTNGELYLTAGGNITTGGGPTTAGTTLTFTTTDGQGNITIDAAAPITGTTVNLTTGATVTGGNITGGLITGTDVNLTVNNATGDIDVDTEATNLLASADMNGGNINVDEVTGVNIDGATGRNVTVTAANGDINVNGVVTATKTVDLSTTGGTGDINVNGKSSLTGKTVNLTTGAATTSGDVNLDADVDGDPYGTSTVNIEALGASGDITRTSGRIRANSVNLHSVNGDIGVNTNNGRVRTRTDFLTVQADNGNAYIREGNDVTLLSSNAAGDLYLQADDSITTGGGATTAGATLTLLTTGGVGDITIDAAAPITGATVNLTTDATATGGNITGGLITGTDVNLVVNNATGDINVTTEATNLLATADSTGGDITVNETTGVNLVGVSGNDIDITAANGDITTTGAVTGTGTVNLLTTGGTGNILLGLAGPVSGDLVNLTTGAGATSGNIAGDGEVQGNVVTLLSNNGNIGASTAARLNTRATDDLTASAPLGNVWINQHGGDVELIGTNSALGQFFLTTVDPGDITVTGTVSSNDTRLNTTGSSIFVNNSILGTTNVFLTAAHNGSITGPGLISGTNVNLNAVNGLINSNTNATTLHANTLGSIYIQEKNSVNLGTSNAGGVFSLTTGKTLPGLFDPNGGGTILSTGQVSAANVYLNSSGSILSGLNGATNVRSTGRSQFTAQGIIGNRTSPFDVRIGGRLYLAAFSQVNGFSGVLTGRVGGGTPRLTNNPPGIVLFNGFPLGGSAFEVAMRTTMPALFNQFKNQTNPGFNNNMNTTASIVGTDSIQSVGATIINQITQPQPFDLRMIEEERGPGEEDGPVDYRLINISDEQPPEPQEEPITPPEPQENNDGNSLSLKAD